jgi:hypothetical protein
MSPERLKFIATEKLLVVCASGVGCVSMGCLLQIHVFFQLTQVALLVASAALPVMHMGLGIDIDGSPAADVGLLRTCFINAFTGVDQYGDPTVIGQPECVLALVCGVERVTIAVAVTAFLGAVLLALIVPRIIMERGDNFSNFSFSMRMQKPLVLLSILFHAGVITCFALFLSLGANSPVGCYLGDNSFFSGLPAYTPQSPSSVADGGYLIFGCFGVTALYTLAACKLIKNACCD